MLLQSVVVEPFAIPLIAPFTISRASVDTTRAVLVRAHAEGTVGYGEAALPLGAEESTEDLTHAINAAAAALVDRTFDSLDAIADAVDACFKGPPPARSGLHCALIDAFARTRGVPLYQALGADDSVDMVTDITLPIAAPSRQAELAAAYLGRGFRVLKLKVGADLERDCRTVDALSEVSRELSLRFDANEGFDAASACKLIEHTRSRGLVIDCFEQPCPRRDHDGLREVRNFGVPVVADESIASLEDLRTLLTADSVDGVNLKLVKMGGVDRCVAIGLEAMRGGLDVMVGAMIESRLGLTAMAHVVARLGGARWVDLDTAFLLARDPVQGGMHADGPRLSLDDSPGLGVDVGTSASA